MSRVTTVLFILVICVLLLAGLAIWRARHDSPARSGSLLLIGALPLGILLAVVLGTLSPESDLGFWAGIAVPSGFAWAMLGGAFRSHPNLSLIRWSGIAALLAGVSFIVDILLVLTVDADWTNVVYIIAALLMLVGLGGLHALQKDKSDRLEQAGFWTVVVATLGQVVGIIVFLLGSKVLNWLVFPVGFLTVPVGLMLYGVAILQSKVLPRWCGLALIIIPPISIILGDYGGILFGLLWVALGYVLLSWRSTVSDAGS